MINKQLNSVAVIIAGQSPESSTYNTNGDGLPFFQGKADFQEKYPQVRIWSNSKMRKEAEPGDILMSVRAPVGSVNICNQKSIIGRGLSAIRPLSNLNSEFLYFFLKANEKKIANLGTGSTFNSITQATLKKIEIPLPPVAEQIRIANLLGKVEVLIATRQENLQQLDELLKSVFLEMFGDPIRNDKGWEKSELKKFGKISTGNTPPRKDESSYSSKHIEWIKTDNIPSDSVYVTHATEYLSEHGSKKGRIVNKGALLVACIAGSVGSIGRAALTNRSVAFNQQINAIQPSNDVNSFFLYVLFKISKAYIQSYASKGMKKILTKGDFEKIKMILPPIKLQDHFAQIVEKIENVKTQYQQSLTELGNLYGALSQKAFKGELDLSRLMIEHIEPLSTVGTHTFDNTTVNSSSENRQISSKRKPEINLGPVDDRFKYVTEQIKKEFATFDFQFKDIIESQAFDNYRHCNTSEDLKKNTTGHEYDLKCYLFDCLEGKSSLLRMEQFFYDALDDLQMDKIKLKSNKKTIIRQIKEGSLKQDQLSGIYFRIIK